MQSLLFRFWGGSSGQGLGEDALVVELVAIGLILIRTVRPGSIGQVFETSAGRLNDAPTGRFW